MTPAPTSQPSALPTPHPTSLPTFAVETVVRVPASLSLSYLNATAIRFNARVEHALAFGVVIERAIFQVRAVWWVMLVIRVRDLVL